MKRDDYDPWQDDLLPHVAPWEVSGEIQEFDRLSPDKLMRDAGLSLESYLHNACLTVDRKFGVGSAQRMPEVVASLVNAQATEVAAMVSAGAAQWAARRLATAMED
jgi:hypothetical protein